MSNLYSPFTLTKPHESQLHIVWIPPLTGLCVIVPPEFTQVALSVGSHKNWTVDGV